MKLFATLFVLLLFVGGYGIKAQTGLIGCYPLNNNAKDYSGNGHDGITHYLTPTADRFGNPNAAYHFSGDTSSIEIAADSFMVNQYTYSVWCKPTALPSDPDGYVMVSVGGSGLDQLLGIINNSSVNLFGFSGGSWAADNSSHHCGQGKFPSLNQWHHVVFTRNDTTLCVYVDDTLACSTSSGNVSAGYSGPPYSFRIGSRYTSDANNFRGDIDDVRIYNKALTLSQIRSMSVSCSATGFESSAKQNTIGSLYPNPLVVSSMLTLNEAVYDAEVTIYDMHGSAISRNKMNGNSLEIKRENLERGIYFLVVKDTKNQYSQKFVVE